MVMKALYEVCKVPLHSFTTGIPFKQRPALTRQPLPPFSFKQARRPTNSSTANSMSIGPGTECHCPRRQFAC